MRRRVDTLNQCGNLLNRSQSLLSWMMRRRATNSNTTKTTSTVAILIELDDASTLEKKDALAEEKAASQSLLSWMMRRRRNHSLYHNRHVESQSLLSWMMRRRCEANGADIYQMALSQSLLSWMMRRRHRHGEGRDCHRGRNPY